MDFKIEKGVPLPRILGKVGSPAKYPFRDMEVGDSFFDSNRTARSMSSTAFAAAKYIGGGVKFTCRTVDGGVRVWRVK